MTRPANRRNLVNGQQWNVPDKQRYERKGISDRDQIAAQKRRFVSMPDPRRALFPGRR